MRTSTIQDQGGIPQQVLITEQVGSPSKQEKIEDQAQPHVASPHTFIKYLQDYYEALDSLFINQASGEEPSGAN